jgi:hypothetical protein
MLLYGVEWCGVLLWCGVVHVLLHAVVAMLWLRCCGCDAMVAMLWFLRGGAVPWSGAVRYCGVVWCGVVWCGVVWCGVVLSGVVLSGVVCCDVMWCDGVV